MMWDFHTKTFRGRCYSGRRCRPDREYRAKEAGYRTHFLVSLGSADHGCLPIWLPRCLILENSVSLDPSRGRPMGEVASVSSGRKYDHHPETIRAGIDYRRRYLGDRRYRSGRRLRQGTGSVSPPLC